MWNTIKRRLVQTAFAVVLISTVASIGMALLMQPPVMRFAMAQLNTIFEPTFVGKVKKQGQTPTIAGTGAPALTADSTDFMGVITYGTGGLPATLTFSSTWTTAPFCLFSINGLTSIGGTFVISATTITTTGNGISTGAVITYLCIGRV